jgi:ankyrin repeat protein
VDAEQRDSVSPAIRHEIGRALCVSAGKSEDITRILLAAGVDIDFREKDRVTTALTIASSLKRVSMLKLLLEAGANPNILNSDIWGPLASATLNKCDFRPWDDTRRFVKYPQDSQNDMPHLPECLKIKKVELNDQMKDEMMTVARLLFEYGADPARAGGTWALHNAVCTQNYEMARLLIDKGIRLRIPSLDASQQVAMDQAVEECDFDTITRLIPLGTRNNTYCRRRIRTGRSKYRYDQN